MWDHVRRHPTCVFTPICSLGQISGTSLNLHVIYHNILPDWTNLWLAFWFDIIGVVSAPWWDARIQFLCDLCCCAVVVSLFCLGHVSIWTCFRCDLNMLHIYIRNRRIGCFLFLRILSNLYVFHGLLRRWFFSVLRVIYYSLNLLTLNRSKLHSVFWEIDNSNVSFQTYIRTNKHSK